MTGTVRGDRIRSFSRSLIELHRSPHAEVRLAVWGFWTCLLVLALRAGPIRNVALGTWLVFNVVLLLVAVGWGLFHVKAMWRAQSTALSWAFALAVLFSLAFSSSYEQSLGLGGPDSSRVRALVLLANFLAAVTLFFPLGFCGASLGALTRRPDEPADIAAARGITGWWLAMGLLIGGGALANPLLLAHAPAALLPTAAYVLSWPALAAVLTRLFARPRTAQRAGRKLMGRLIRRLQLVVTWRGRTARIDLRGAALGLLAAAVTLSAGWLGLLRPLGARGLGELQFTSSVLLPRLGGATGPVPAAPVAVLDMDGAAQYAARTSRSEAALQAEVIRKLSGFGVRAIVLVPPLLQEPGAVPALDAAADLGELPPPDERDYSRSEADLPKLVAAMRDAGNVFLAVPRGELGHGAVGQLAIAAAGTGLAEFGYFGAGRLPGLSLAETGMQPLPVVLAAALNRAEPTVALLSNRTARFGDTILPTVARGLVLIDFGGAGPTGRFRRIDYSAVLRGQMIWTSTHEQVIRPAAGEASRVAGAPAWVPPGDFLRGRVVFLDSFVRRSQDTPVGAMPTQELLAHGTATLLGGRLVRTPPPGWVGLVTVLAALLAGHLSLRRDPLPAAWRLAVLSLILFAAVAGRFLLLREWVDPVPPLTAAALATLLVVQLTLLTERDARERNRALLQRFVAPQVVDELLENPEGLGLGGKRREVVVLFADVRGFTPFAERHTPEEVIDTINAYMTALTIALHNHGGLLDKYTGDGLMAIFRVGEQRQDDLLRAVSAGLEMRDAADALTRQFVRQGRDALDIGLAAHGGEAVVGLVGNPNQFNYTALGYTVAVTQRLEALAAGGEFLISDTLYQDVRERVQAAAGGPVRVKGVTEPIRPYSVTAIRPAAGAPPTESEVPAIDLPL